AVLACANGKALLDDPRISFHGLVHPRERGLGNGRRAREHDVSRNARRAARLSRVHRSVRRARVRRARRAHRALAADVVGARPRARFVGRRHFLRSCAGGARVRVRHAGVLRSRAPRVLRRVRRVAARALQRDRGSVIRRHGEGRLLRRHPDSNVDLARWNARARGLSRLDRRSVVARRDRGRGLQAALAHARVCSLGLADDQQDTNPEVLTIARRYAALAERSAVRTRLGVRGYCRRRTPVASKNALPIAATTAGRTSSPAPLLRSSSRWIRIGVTSGCSPKRIVRYELQSTLVTLVSLNCTSSQSARLAPCTHMPTIWLSTIPGLIASPQSIAP